MTHLSSVTNHCDEKHMVVAMARGEVYMYTFGHREL
jgi:hypothetical protein